jgi:peroxiredoxin
MIKVGDKAPDFVLPLTNGAQIKLSEKLNTVAPLALVFYKYNCPTCQFTFQYLPRIAAESGLEHFVPIAQDSLAEAVEFKNK